jgi:hypothetical protein
MRENDSIEVAADRRGRDYASCFLAPRSVALLVLKLRAPQASIQQVGNTLTTDTTDTTDHKRWIKRVGRRTAWIGPKPESTTHAT